MTLKEELENKIKHYDKMIESISLVLIEYIKDTSNSNRHLFVQTAATELREYTIRISELKNVLSLLKKEV